MARLTRQWRSILGRQATKVIRAKAGWARLGTLASEEVLDCATTLPREPRRAENAFQARGVRKEQPSWHGSDIDSDAFFRRRLLLSPS
jgi:hypothetical protein